MKTVQSILTIILLVTSSGCMSAIIKCPPTHKKVLPSEFNKKFISEQLKADLDFMFKTMEQVHPNLYAYTSKSTIEREIEKLKRHLTPSTRSEFYLKITPLVAMLNDGHTSVWLPYEEYNYYTFQKKGVLFPFEISIENTRIYVKLNYSNDNLIKAGDELIFINGKPVKEIISELMKFESGEQQEFKEKALSKLFGKYFWLKYDSIENFEINFISKSEQKYYNRKVKGVTAEVIYNKYQKYQAKKKKIGNLGYSYYSLPNKKIGILSLQVCYGDLKLFRSFLKKTFSQIKNENTSSLIIDIRENPGGQDYFVNTLVGYLTDKPIVTRVDWKISSQIKRGLKECIVWYLRWLPLQWLHPIGRQIWSAEEGTVITVKNIAKMPKNNPLRFKGNLYLLVSSYTFSSACDLAAIIKDYKLGTLIGDETGGLASSYGATYSFDLPNTKLGVSVSSKYMLRPSGKDDGRGILPDYEVKQSVKDLSSERDTVMEFTKNLIIPENK